jgi:hypothetical protein
MGWEFVTHLTTGTGSGQPGAVMRAVVCVNETYVVTDIAGINDIDA